MPRSHHVRPSRFGPRWLHLTTLQAALAVSVGVHAALIGWHWADPAGFDRMFKAAPLEVILVNASSTEVPAEAQALAQAALAGGGSLKEGRATSPLPASPQTEMGNAADDARQRVDQLQDQQQQLLAQIRREMALLPPPDPHRDNGTPQEREPEEPAAFNRPAVSSHKMFKLGGPASALGTATFSVTCIYSLINALERQWGVHWAVGGTGKLVQGLVKLMQGQGGTLRCNAEVKRIDIEQGKARGVTLASGEHIAADIVISNADTAWTYRNLVAPEHRRHWTDRRIDNGRYSMSLFVWYFGTRKQYTGVPHHMMVLGPRYKELLTDIFKRHKLTADFSLYLHRPTATDPTMAPPGHDTFYALAPVTHLDSGTDWATQAEPMRRAVAQVLDRTVLPGFEKQLTASFVTTPQDFHDRLLSFKGAAFGLEPLLMQSAWFRPHNRSEDVNGLYMVGASTHPGAGVPGVLMSAKALDSVVPHAQAFQAARA